MQEMETPSPSRNDDQQESTAAAVLNGNPSDGLRNGVNCHGHVGEVVVNTETEAGDGARGQGQGPARSVGGGERGKAAPTAGNPDSGSSSCFETVS